MKSSTLLVAASFLLASGLAATSARAQSTAPLASAPPPPGMNDPGVKPLPPPPKAPAVPVPKSAAGQHLPAMQDSADTPNDGKHMTLPDVSSHQEGENEVEEYRRSGMLYMVVVTPKHGIPQSYTVDPDGTRHMQNGELPVHPAMYKVLEWGKSKPAEASSSDSATDGG